MAGLVPAIHVLNSSKSKEDVDARDKRGHDDGVENPVVMGPRLRGDDTEV